MQQGSQPRPGEGSGWVRTRAQGYECPQLKQGCNLGQGVPPNAVAEWAQPVALLCTDHSDLPFSLLCTLPAILRAVLTAAGSSLPSLLGEAALPRVMSEHPGGDQGAPPRLCLDQGPRCLCCLQLHLASAPTPGQSRAYSPFPHLTELVNFSLL